jgi:membrane protease YdiL (CAAX protease family)
MVATSVVIGLNQAVLVSSGHLLAATVIAGALVVALVNAAPLVESQLGPGSDSRAVAAGFRALALVSVIPLTGATLPLSELSVPAAELLVAVPVCVAAFWIPCLRSMIVALLVRPTDLRSQAAIAAGGLPLGLVAYFLDGESAQAVTAFGVVIVGSAAVATAAAEEIVFRGALQQALGQVLGTAGVAIAAALSIAAYFGTGWLLFPMALAAALFSIAVHRTEVLWGALIGHIALSFGAAVVWPAIFEGKLAAFHAVAAAVIEVFVEIP